MHPVNLGRGNALQSVLSKTTLEASQIRVGLVGASFLLREMRENVS